jgi:RNA polymerase sigma-70 factor (ECF subfamily)
MEDTSDSHLVEAARAGDSGALETLIERYQPRVYRFGLKMCRTPEDAEDILQDTLLAMARTVHAFRGGSSISTWLWSIARSFCIKKRRRSKFAPEREESLEAGAEARRMPDPARLPDEAVAGEEIRAAIDAAIDALDPMYREVLVLRDVEGLRAPEVAEVLGVSVEAVKSRLHRARVAVRTRVAPLLGIPGAAGACPDVLLLFSRHLEGEIGPDLCAEMERHLAACGRCRADCDSLKRTLALCQAAPPPRVPAAIQASIRTAVRKLMEEGTLPAATRRP